MSPILVGGDYAGYSSFVVVVVVAAFDVVLGSNNNGGYCPRRGRRQGSANSTAGDEALFLLIQCVMETTSCFL
jgi:hypothetical protein